MKVNADLGLTLFFGQRGSVCFENAKRADKSWRGGHRGTTVGRGSCTSEMKPA